MEQQIGSKLGKEYVKAIYCHSAYLTYMQSVSCEMPRWMNLKLESRSPGKISITSDMQMISPCRWYHLQMTESEEELKSLLMKVKEESEKGGLKLSISLCRSNWSTSIKRFCLSKAKKMKSKGIVRESVSWYFCICAGHLFSVQAFFLQTDGNAID